MSRFTAVQKAAFSALAKRYSPAVHAVVSRGDAESIEVRSREEAALLDEFADRICGMVQRDHPDYDGSDEDINADAELVVHMVSNVLADSGFAV
jgi:hypothetical protein